MNAKEDRHPMKANVFSGAASVVEWMLDQRFDEFYEFTSENELITDLEGNPMDKETVKEDMIRIVRILVELAYQIEHAGPMTILALVQQPVN